MTPWRPETVSNRQGVRALRTACLGWKFRSDPAGLRTPSPFPGLCLERERGQGVRVKAKNYRQNPLPHPFSLLHSQQKGEGAQTQATTPACFSRLWIQIL